MKKMIIASMAFAMIIGCSESFTQRVTGGIKANANLSNFIISDIDNLDNPMRVGASVGGFLKWDITKHFALQPEVMFNFKASNLKETTTKAHQSYEYWGMEIPVYAVGQTQIGNGRGYFGIGPYVGYGFSAKTFPGGNLYSDDTLQRWDFGAGAMIGYELRNGISFNAGYQIGFIDALDSNKKNATMLPQTVSLGLGYRF